MPSPASSPPGTSAQLWDRLHPEGWWLGRSAGGKEKPSGQVVVFVSHEVWVTTAPQEHTHGGTAPLKASAQKNTQFGGPKKVHIMFLQVLGGKQIPKYNLSPRCLLGWDTVSQMLQANGTWRHTWCHRVGAGSSMPMALLPAPVAFVPHARNQLRGRHRGLWHILPHHTGASPVLWASSRALIPAPALPS